MPYKYIEHTADVMIEATGKTFEQALEAAALGMFELVAEDVKEETWFEIEEKSDNLEDLVVFVLSRLNSEAEIREMELSHMKVEEFLRDEKGFFLKAKVFAGHGKMKNIVKAATHHELSVKEEKDKVTIRVLLDV